MAEECANETTEDFLKQMKHTMFEGFKALGIAFGIQSGLFDTLVGFQSNPKTSQEIADAGNFKERYVREWLGAMVCSGIVEYNAVDKTYYIPAHRVPAFKKDELVGRTVTWCAGIPIMSEAYNAMLEVIKKDGPLGVPYSKYTQFHQHEDDISSMWFRDQLCQSFIASHPALKKGLENGFRVLDVGCGQGGAAFNIASHFPNCSAVGVDIGEDAIEYATEYARTKNVGNVKYVCADASKMPAEWTDTFDFALFFKTLHDVPRPDLMLSDIRRVLKPGGMLSCLDPNMNSNLEDNLSVGHAPMFYTASLLHCLPVSYQFPGSMGLGTCYGRENTVKLLEQCGFTVHAVEATRNYEDTLHYWCIANPE
ncbi:S-adenosylmethionine-dependent methyltransferase Rv2258c-like [Diadema antillarum]|uniref:S-adenosylmethionine-dependent methyltransferase Rv2258c-like n=1 Tax=Diadema antillarum TaxID=105358 RepID=UPI003A83D340